MALEIDETCKEHFRKVRKWAFENGKKDRFEHWMNYLRWFGCGTMPRQDESKHRVRLFRDFAPNSFSLMFERKGKDGEWAEAYMCGGLIYHDSSGDWSVHT